MASFITVDGVDGVGKTTVCKALAEALKGKYFKSPSAPFDHMRAEIDKVSDPLTRYFFYRAAVQHDSREIIRLLAEDVSVVCDRFVWSTYAYHVAMDERVEGLFETTGLPQPDLAVLLSASHEVRWQRLADRFLDQSYDKYLERNHALQAAAARIFQDLDLFEIDTTETQVFGVVEAILKRMTQS